MMQKTVFKERIKYLLEKGNEFNTKYPNEKRIKIYIGPSDQSEHSKFCDLLMEDYNMASEFERLTHSGDGISILLEHFEENIELDLWVVSDERVHLPLNDTLKQYIAVSPLLNFEY